MAQDAVVEIRRITRGEFTVGGKSFLVLEANGMFAWQPKIIWDVDIAKEQSVVDQGACINERDKCGETPLMKAAGRGRGHTEIVRLLLERGADVTVKKKSGKTVLPYAAGNCEIKDLLSGGLTPYRRCSLHCFPLQSTKLLGRGSEFCTRGVRKFKN
jgi:hypothetical protein